MKDLKKLEEIVEAAGSVYRYLSKHNNETPHGLVSNAYNMWAQLTAELVQREDETKESDIEEICRDMQVTAVRAKAAMESSLERLDKIITRIARGGE